MRTPFWRAFALGILLVLGSPSHSRAQTGPATRADSPKTDAPFEKEIRAFEATDARVPPQTGGILFLGSSSIRKWTTLSSDFPNQPVMNRGFGGSQIRDSTRYAARIVVPYAPRLIIFYAGDNDLAAGRSPAQVLADFQEFIGVIEASLPKTRVLFVSIKPSPARARLFEQMKEANSLIRQFTEHDPKLGFIDVFTPMLGADGKARPELFGPDHLHMTQEGYKLWTSIIGPRMKDEG